MPFYPDMLKVKNKWSVVYKFFIEFVWFYWSYLSYLPARIFFRETFYIGSFVKRHSSRSIQWRIQGLGLGVWQRWLAIPLKGSKITTPYVVVVIFFYEVPSSAITTLSPQRPKRSKCSSVFQVLKWLKCPSATKCPSST